LQILAVRVTAVAQPDWVVGAARQASADGEGRAIVFFAQGGSRMLIGSVSSRTAASKPEHAMRGRYLLVGAHVLDVDTLRLLTAPEKTRLTPKAAAVLLRLAESAGRTLSRDELLDEVWRGTCPTPDVLTQAIADLRRCLGDDPHAPHYIETLPRLGYRLLVVTRFVDELPLPASPDVHDKAIRRTVVRARRSRARSAALLVGACLPLLAAIAFFALQARHSGVAPIVSRWQVSERRMLTTDPGPENFPSVSPDGSRIAYSIGDPAAHKQRIVQRSMQPSRTVRLTSAESGAELYPVWSPDSASVAFMRFSGDACAIIVVPALGGAERRAGDCYGGLVIPFSWAPDGAHLLTTTPSGSGTADMAIVRIPLDGGAYQRLAYQHDATDTDLDARASPDGAWIAFRRGANPYSDLFVTSAAGGSVRQLTHVASRIRGYAWTRDGSALVFSSGQGGEPALYVVDIADGHVEALGIAPAEFPSAARVSETIAYEIPRVRMQLSRLPLDEQEASADIVPSTGSDSMPVLSPVGDDLAFVSDRAGMQQLWLHEAASGETWPFDIADASNLCYPAWRGDGLRLLVTVRGASGGRLVEVDIASRTQRVLTAATDDVRAGSYSTQPDRFVAVVNVPGGRTALVEISTHDGRESARRVLAHDVARVDTVADALYFTRISTAGLFRMDLRTGSESRLTAVVQPAHLDGWRVLNGQVYYIAPQATGASELRLLDPVGGNERVIAKIPSSLADMNFAVARDGRSVVVTRALAEDTDVGAIVLSHVRHD
jgi:Tol biopolymer transport system component/DNA-binding winged helix-turn-helix (wHTH) protein